MNYPVPKSITGIVVHLGTTRKGARSVQPLPGSSLLYQEEADSNSSAMSERGRGSAQDCQ